MNELVEALRAEERLAPDPAEVLAGVAVGIRRRRRRRLVGYAASVVVMVLVVGGLAVGVLRKDDQTAPAERTVIPTGDWTRTLRFGYLPDGMTPDGWGASTIGEVASFTRDDARYLRVVLYSPDLRPQAVQPDWQPVTIAGRPGRVVSRTYRTLIKWQMPSGRWADLEYGDGRPDGVDVQPALQASALQIAAGITEGDPEPVRVAFALTYLPRGMRVVGIRVRPDGLGIIEVASESQAAPRFETAKGEEAITDDQLVIDRSKAVLVSVTPGDVVVDPTYTRVDDVQGRPAWLIDSNRGIEVDWEHGQLAVTPAGWDVDPALTPTEFRAVAEGVRWTG